MELIIIFSAKYLGYILLVVFFILFLRNRNKNFLFIPLISAFISRFVFTELIRFFYFRPRPFVAKIIVPLIDHAPTTSFPSGHAAFYFALSAGIYSFNKKAGYWFFTASYLIGLARVFAGVHYFSDIFGGLALGFFSFWLVHFFEKRRRGSLGAPFIGNGDQSASTDKSGLYFPRDGRAEPRSGASS